MQTQKHDIINFQYDKIFNLLYVYKHMLFEQCLLLLEKELVSLGAMCATSLLKDTAVLPFAGGFMFSLFLFMCVREYVIVIILWF